MSRRAAGTIALVEAESACPSPLVTMSASLITTCESVVICWVGSSYSRYRQLADRHVVVWVVRRAFVVANHDVGLQANVLDLEGLAIGTGAKAQRLVQIDDRPIAGDRLGFLAVVRRSRSREMA